jgi:probable HAF family extracellular repeat protein
MSTKLAFTLLALIAALAAGTSRRFDKPSRNSHLFTPLGDLPGGAVSSAARAVSADGSVVIGYSNSGVGMEAFRWTRRGGMVGLGFPEAFAASADGSEVVGYHFVAGGAEPVRWSLNGGLQGIGNITECVCGVGRGISADGSAIVGSCAPGFAIEETAFYWTPTSGIARLEPFPNAVGAEAHAVSNDGDVVVGVVHHEPSRRSAFRWTSKRGSVDLGALPGDDESMAHAVSANGSVVVGISWPSCRSFRWSQETGMVDLGTLPGGSHSCALGASADGSIIIGQCNGEFGPEAFVWDATHGMRGLRQLLMSEAKLGGRVDEWKLRSATAVSRDGSTIVGNGINPSGNQEGWVARIGNVASPEMPGNRIDERLSGTR